MGKAIKQNTNAKIKQVKWEMQLEVKLGRLWMSYFSVILKFQRTVSHETFILFGRISKSFSGAITFQTW